MRSQSSRGGLMNSVSLCLSLLSRKLVVSARMASTSCNYEDAIRKLNLLQSNKSTIEQIRRDIKTGQKCTNLEDMENFLLRTGVTLSKLDELSVIHVAGTKGKGSTSAMCESILRRHGFRTGFYSSPHLVAVCERIRLDGRVLSKQKFAEHFHEIYNLLDSSKASEGDMPKYFAFLTILAFNVFLKERVDVAIVEVGIGGAVDYTNILRKVPVVGITALGLDHTSILGNTLAEIAEAKAGIMKEGCEAYTVTQPPEAMAVLRRVAATVQCPLKAVPAYDSYTFPKQTKPLQIDIEAYKTNTSLAIQLAYAWMRIAKLQQVRRRTSLKRLVSGKVVQSGFTELDPYITDNEKVADFITEIPNETVEGLRACKWPGRYQVVEADYATFYLDGAHTKESMEICADWFGRHNRYQEQVLVFSATGDRDAEVLLKPLKKLNFKTVFFVIPTAYKCINEKNDNYSTMEQKELIARCYNHSHVWKRNHGNGYVEITVMECVSDALNHIKRRNSHYTVDKSSVLITGSLHLVGAALSILDPHLSLH